MKTERMKKYLWLFSLALLTNILLSPALAADIFQEYDKVIWINQIWQTGAAYERGKKVREFPVLTGDAETTTKPGIYVVQVKQEDYYSRKYQTPMPVLHIFQLYPEGRDSRRRSTAAATKNRICHPWLYPREAARH